MGSRGATGWERLFWMVFESTANPVVLLDAERRIVSLNDAAVRLLGGDRARLAGSSLGDSVLPAERERATAEWQEFLTSGEYAGTRHLLRADGSTVHVDFAARLAEVDGEQRAIYVATHHEDGAASHDAPSPAELALTAREREVVIQIALGRETAEIATELQVSSETVRSHVRNAMAKLDVHTRAQLVAVVLCDEGVTG